MGKLINLLYSEIIKLKKCYIVFAIIACSMLMPVVSFIRYLIFLPKVNLQSYISLNEMLMFILIMIMITTALSSYIFLREYTDNAIKVLYSYPISKVSICMSKIFVIYIIIAFIYVLHFMVLFGGGLFLYRGGFLLKDMSITNEFFLTHLKMYLDSMVLLFSIVPLLVFITNIFKNYIITVIVGVFSAVINLFIVQSELAKFFPFILPTIPFVNHSINATNIIGLALGWFIVGIILCIYQFSRFEEL